MAAWAADEIMPIDDVSYEVAIVVDADPEAVWEAQWTPIGSRSASAFPPGAVLRVLSENVSHLLHGEPPSKPPRSMRLRETTTMPAVQGGWVLLRERPSEELALVLVGKFWRAR